MRNKYEMLQRSCDGGHKKRGKVGYSLSQKDQVRERLRGDMGYGIGIWDRGYGYGLSSLRLRTAISSLWHTAIEVLINKNEKIAKGDRKQAIGQQLP